MNTANPLEAAQTLGLRLAIFEQTVRREVKLRFLDERGEGVISMAIAVLVIAALGAVMIGIFTDVGRAAGKQAEESIANLGG